MVLGRDAVAGQGAYISLLLPPAARENPALHFGFPLTAYTRTGRFRSCFIQLLRVILRKIRLSCCHRKVSVWPQTQPLSSASGSKRYNTLDFPWKVVCHETAGFFGFFRSKGNSPPLNTPGKGERCSPLKSPCQQGCCRPYGPPS